MQKTWDGIVNTLVQLYDVVLAEVLSAAVELVRPLFMDRWPEHPLRHALVLVVFAVVSFWIALALTRKRFRA